MFWVLRGREMKRMSDWAQGSNMWFFFVKNASFNQQGHDSIVRERLLVSETLTRNMIRSCVWRQMSKFYTTLQKIFTVCWKMGIDLTEWLVVMNLFIFIDKINVFKKVELKKLVLSGITPLWRMLLVFSLYQKISSISVCIADLFFRSGLRRSQEQPNFVFSLFLKRNEEASWRIWRLRVRKLRPAFFKQQRSPFCWASLVDVQARSTMGNTV